MHSLSNLKNLSQLSKAAQAKRGKEVLSLPLDDVTSKPQVRKRFRNLEELAASLQTEGQQSPIIVSPKNADGKYVIQKGERRWRAAKIAKLPTIDVIINDQEQTPLDETAGELVENIQRDALTPLEIANALQAFISAGWKQIDIADRIGKNVSFVSNHLSLLKLPQCVLALYEQDVTADNETLNNLRRLYDLDAALCEKVCENAVSNGISRQQSRELLNSTREAQEAAQRPNPSPTPSEPLKDAQGAAPAAQTEEQGIEPSVQVATPHFHAPEDRSIDSGDVQPVEELAHVQVSPPKSPQWKYARPDSLVITVNVQYGGKAHQGTLMLDRVAADPAMVWVQLSADSADSICVNVSDVALVSIG